MSSPKRSHHRGGRKRPPTPQPPQPVPGGLKHLEQLLEKCEALSPLQCRDCLESARCSRWWDERVLKGAGIGGLTESELEKLTVEFLRFSRLGSFLGSSIAKRLGVKYEGVQEKIGMQFTDPLTGSTFYGNTLDEVELNLAALRAAFAEVEQKLAHKMV